MQVASQKRILNELLDTIRKDIEGAIDTHGIPEEWDGIELRELVFDKARDLRALTRVGLNGHTQRMRKYRLFMANNNI